MHRLRRSQADGNGRPAIVARHRRFPVLNDAVRKCLKLGDECLAEAVRGELKRTRHKKKPGLDEYIDKVADADDHIADSARYGAFSRWGKTQSLNGARLVYV